MNGAPLTRTPPRQSWGRGPSPQGWRRLQARRSTCLLLPAVQRRRVESLVLGALSSSPVHRALVLVLGTNIAVLLDCSKSSRQCSLPYLLTYATQEEEEEEEEPHALPTVIFQHTVDPVTCVAHRPTDTHRPTRVYGTHVQSYTVRIRACIRRVYSVYGKVHRCFFGGRTLTCRQVSPLRT